jgi:hypothetical protein
VKALARTIFMVAIVIPLGLLLSFCLAVVGAMVMLGSAAIGSAKTRLAKLLSLGRAREMKGPKPADLQPGQLMFNCGVQDAPADEQIALYHQFIDKQKSLGPEIESALRQMHSLMRPPKPFSDPSDAILFPDDAERSDVALQCFRISAVDLDPRRGGRIVLSLETLFGHYEEHGCHIVIRNGKVEKFGTWDEVLNEGDDYGEESGFVS